MPFLLIKKVADTTRAIVERDQATLLGIAKIVCAANLPEGECEAYSEVDLFNETREFMGASRLIPFGECDEDRRNYKDFQKLDFGKERIKSRPVCLNF